jgi:hypothetical protein
VLLRAALTYYKKRCCCAAPEVYFDSLVGLPTPVAESVAIFDVLVVVDVIIPRRDHLFRAAVDLES